MDVDKPKAESKGFELPWVSPPDSIRAPGAGAIAPACVAAALNGRPRAQVEKYRPSLIKDIVGNNEAVARLQKAFSDLQ